MSCRDARGASEAPRNPITTEKRTLALDTTNQGGGRLQELVQALDMIIAASGDGKWFVDDMLLEEVS